MKVNFACQAMNFKYACTICAYGQRAMSKQCAIRLRKITANLLCSTQTESAPTIQTKFGKVIQQDKESSQNYFLLPTAIYPQIS